MSWNTRRKKPYTEIGVRRVSCVRCGNPAVYQWMICSEGNHWRALCPDCDVKLNALVLRWMRHPEAERLIREYTKKVKELHHAS